MPKVKSKRQELADRIVQKVWWSPAVNRKHDQTGIAHAIHAGESLCGARPFTMGASFEFAVEAGCRECERCRSIINAVAKAKMELQC